MVAIDALRDIDSIVAKLILKPAVFLSNRLIPFGVREVVGFTGYSILGITKVAQASVFEKQNHLRTFGEK